MAIPVTPDMLDPKTPEDVIIRSEAPEPVSDPTLGIPVKVNRQGTPRHRLVTIGDSLTQGFQSGAIFNTKLSYPMMIAREMGWEKIFVTLPMLALETVYQSTLKNWLGN